MQNNTLCVQRSAILLFLQFIYALNLSASHHNTHQDDDNLHTDQQLVLLLKYRKNVQNKKRISSVQQGLAHRIFPLLNKKYSQPSFKEILGGTHPTPTDQHIFLSLQWAYQKGKKKASQKK